MTRFQISLLFLLSLTRIAFAACVRGDGLNTRAKHAGKLYFGTATDDPRTDPVYNAQLKNISDFGQITVGNSQKWDSTEPSQNSFSFDRADVTVGNALNASQLVRCHTLVWHNQLPSWVTDGNFDNATLISIMENHINNLVTHFKGKCYSWDVVNEAIGDDAEYRPSVFLDTIGPAYIPIAFAAAARADPKVKLYYNDYNIETPSAKSNKTIELVKMIQAYGVKIDGVGAQAHLIGGQVPDADTLKTNLKSFTDLKVDVAYSELDIRIPFPVQEADEAQQIQDYANVVESCRGTKRCVGITVWDWSDDNSWIPTVFEGYGSALPFNARKQPKPVYWSILNAWSQTPCGAACNPCGEPCNPPGGNVPGGDGVPLYGQCGGSGWTGNTTCRYPYECVVFNEYYSQCH